MSVRVGLQRIPRVNVQAAVQDTRSSHLPPGLAALFGLFSFVVCGAAVVATATVVALHIQ
jgi:hypothetical protein